MLAVKRNEKLWDLTEKGPRQSLPSSRSGVRADRLASQVDETGWVRISAGDGAKGPRVYDQDDCKVIMLGRGGSPGRGFCGFWPCLPQGFHPHPDPLPQGRGDFRAGLETLQSSWVYDWAAVEIRPLRELGKGHWLLVRRSIANPGELA